MRTKSSVILIFLWLITFFLLPIFTVLGKFLPPLDFIHGIGDNTWLSFGYLIFIIMVPTATFVTGLIFIFRNNPSKIAIVLYLLVTIFVTFLMYLFAMFFGFFATSFFDKF